MRRRKLTYVAVDRLRRRNVLVGEVVPKSTAIDPAGAQSDQRLHLRSKGKQSGTRMVVERLDAESIAREKQFALVRVPYGERKHADELVETPRAVCGIEMQQHFRVRVRVKRAWQVPAQFAEVVDLAVVHNRVAAKRHRLVAGRAQVHDRQSSVTEADAGLVPHAAIVGTTMPQQFRHGGHGGLPVPRTDDAGYPTHLTTRFRYGEIVQEGTTASNWVAQRRGAMVA